MDILRKVLATYGMSSLLLLTILLAMRSRQHSLAINRWFRAQFYGALVLETVEHIVGWNSPIYTHLYIPYTLIMLAATFGVVIEAWKEVPH